MQRLVKSGNMNIKQRWRWRSTWRKNCLVGWLLTNQGPEKSNKIRVNAHCLVHDRALKKKNLVNIWLEKMRALIWVSIKTIEIKMLKILSKRDCIKTFSQAQAAN